MINILYTIILFNILLIFFKLFKKYNIDNVQALTANYLSGALYCYFYIEEEFYFLEAINSDWINYALILGVLFIVVFYFFAYSVQKIGISITTIANKMSVVIPVIFALFLYPNEQFNITRIFAFFFALLAIYLCSIKSTINLEKKYFWIILVIFLGQGILDVIFNHTIQLFSIELGYSFFIILFLISSLFGMLVIIFERIIYLKNIEVRNILWGIIFGIPNIYSMVFFVRALNHINSSIVFPLVSIGIVASSSLLGVFIFKERLSFINWIGICVSIIAIYLFS